MKRRLSGATRWLLALAAMGTLGFVFGAASHGSAGHRAIRSAHFDTFGAAADAGELQRGWLSAAVPADATDVSEWHDVDTSERYGVFTLARSAALEPSPPPADFARSVAAARRVHPEDTRLPRIGRSSDVFVACQDSGKFASIVAVIARDAEAGVYWCVPRRCAERD